MPTHSILTDDQREYLEGEKELDDNGERSMRGDIRERLRQAVHDLDLLMKSHAMEDGLELNEELEMALVSTVESPEDPPEKWYEEFSAQEQVDERQRPKIITAGAVEGVGILLAAEMLYQRGVIGPFTGDSLDAEDWLSEPEHYISTIEMAIRTACVLYGVQAYDFEIDLDFDTANREEVSEIPPEELLKIPRGGGATLREVREELEDGFGEHRNPLKGTSIGGDVNEEE